MPEHPGAHKGVCRVVTESFPLGTKALHPDWPEARFNVSGMFVFERLVVDVVTSVEATFDCHVPIEAMHGAPAVPWNAGRPSRVPFSLAGLQASLQRLHAKNIGCFPTFTNHLIDNKDLEDRTCGCILDCISQRADLNGVIVASELLSKHIAEKYPALRQVASVIKVTFDGGQGKADYYNELGKRFYRYVVHPDDCRDLKLLDQLDRQKAEIIVNENCVANCPRRARHYTAYARWQRAAGSPEQQQIQQEVDQIVASCPSPAHLRQMPTRTRTCNLTRTEMKAVYDLGFRHFKIQGRADGPYIYSYDLTRFTLEPEFVAPLVHKGVCHAVVPAR